MVPKGCDYQLSRKFLQLCYRARNTVRAAGTCDGDGGGPLIHKNLMTTQAICLIGVSSFGPSSCYNYKKPDVFTKVGYFDDWIEAANIQLLDQLGR